MDAEVDKSLILCKPIFRIYSFFTFFLSFILSKSILLSLFSLLFFFFLFFSIACTRQHNSLSLSIHPSVRPSICLSIGRSNVFQCLLVFLVADTQLYKRLCPSVRWSVRRSVTLKLKTQETRIYNAAVFIECVWVYVSVWEGGLGEAWGWLPLPTRPQRY